MKELNTKDNGDDPKRRRRRAEGKTEMSRREGRDAKIK